MQRRIKALLFAAALILAISGAAYAAQDEDPVGTAAMLDIGMSARAMGMGGAHIAVADDAAVIYYNPAGLALIDGHSVTSLYTNLHGAAGYLALGYAQKNVGGGFLRLNASGIEETDEYANVIGTFGVSDLTEMAGYGREVALGLSLGGTVKLYSQSLADVSGKGVTGDVGALYVMDDGKLSFGAVARNVVGKVRYDNNAEDAFERAFGVGAAYRPSDSLLFAADAVLEDGLAARVGAEYRIKQFALRAGGALDGGEASITAGAGFAMDSFAVDYAYQTHKVLPDSHRISLSVRF
ncbi:MAG TPA: PorV/PorQ family protein [Bacillota bacterium]|nr:PorV/PorQ family protein [Bacillota bacterium]